MGCFMKKLVAALLCCIVLLALPLTGCKSLVKGSGELKTRDFPQSNFSEVKATDGFQVGIHVTGDRGIDVCVDGYIAALKERVWDARHYIIHTDYATPACIERMAKNKIGANVQSAIKWTIGNLMVGITETGGSLIS
jgi:predicted amidohydrolase YtcJ